MTLPELEELLKLLQKYQVHNFSDGKINLNMHILPPLPPALPHEDAIIKAQPQPGPDNLNLWGV